jgi:hypothetical protein
LKGGCGCCAAEREVWAAMVFWWCVDWLGKADRMRQMAVGVAGICGGARWWW